MANYFGIKKRFNLLQAYRWLLAHQQADRERRLDAALLAVNAKPLGDPVQRFPAAPPKRKAAGVKCKQEGV